MRLLGLGIVALLGLPWGPAAVAAAGEEGFRPIFDGKTLNGWDGDPDFWCVEDGAIIGQTTAQTPAKANTFLIWRGGEPGDFELRAEFQLINHNSGIQFRSFQTPQKGQWSVGGYQADMDEANRFTGGLYGEQYRGILAKPGEKTVIGEDHKAKVVGQVASAADILALVKKDGWNEYRIIAQGNHIVLQLNGQTTVDVTDDDKEMRREKGIIALQIHQGKPMKVLFRNLRLKELSQAVTTMPPSGGKKIVLIAGKVSHGYAQHEHYAGCVLLAKCLEQNVPGVHAVVVKDGWPQDEKVLDGAAAIVLYSDGGEGQPMIPHLDQLAKRMKQGVGIALLHYAVEVPKGAPGDFFKDAIGGYFETFWSVNPHWRAEFTEFPKHPVANGLKPFALDDEWYYHMRFADAMEDVTPILSAIPPDSTRAGKDGAHSGNAEVRSRKGMPEHLAWVRVRPDGGRGFGFTGGHWHWNWANDGFRTTVLNGIVWVAGLEVPPGGVPSKTPTLEELQAGLDKTPDKKFDREKVLQMLQEWQKQSAGK
jgi:hypothetical protein